MTLECFLCLCKAIIESYSCMGDCSFCKKKTRLIFVDFTFTPHADKWCSSYFMDARYGDLDICKELCAGSSDCAGVAIWSGQCLFLKESCRDNLVSSSGLTVYMKTIN